MSLDFNIHMDPYFSEQDRLFCECGEELVYEAEHEALKCLKCIQEQQAQEEECYGCGMMVQKHQIRGSQCIYCQPDQSE